MAHEVYTAIEGGERTEVLLPLYSGERQVRAARIVSVGLAATAGITRLALEGGAHVDVSKAWVQKNGPTAGNFYAQTVAPDSAEVESAEVIAADVFEHNYTLGSSLSVDAEAQEQRPGHVIEDFAKLDEHPAFIEWFKDHFNAHALGAKLAVLFEKFHVHGRPYLPHEPEQVETKTEEPGGAFPEPGIGVSTEDLPPAANSQVEWSGTGTEPQIETADHVQTQSEAE